MFNLASAKEVKNFFQLKVTQKINTEAISNKKTSFAELRNPAV